VEGSFFIGGSKEVVLKRQFVNCGYLALAVTLCLGCGSRQVENPKWPARFPVTGTVTYKGNPVEGADVTFMSVDKNSTGTGKTDSAGKFSLSTYTQDDGVVSGSHMVTIRRVDVVDNTPKDVDVSAGGKATPPKITWIVPEKYSISGKSGLSADVSESAKNDFTFDLK
jgi:hypothetical protein